MAKGKKDKKLSLRLGLLSTLTALTLIGTTAGSLAWYAYSRSVRFSFVGTSVAKSALLSVGLVDDNHYLSDADIEEYDLVREAHDGHSICFTNSKNGFSLQALRSYLFHSPYAVDKLFPITTQDRLLTDTSDLTLYKSPEYSETTLTIEAEKSEYVRLPFAFKILNDEQEYVADKKVWLTESVVQAEENINNSVRIFVETADYDFLMKPADQTATKGSTKVGGLLDLDGDGKYDFNKSNMEEYVYGKFNGTVPISSTAYPTPEELAPLDNVNGVEDTSAASTFLAKHQEGAFTADISGVPAKYAEYETFGTVKPSIGPNGQYYVGETGIPLASTSSGSKIGYTTMTIFIEGWDHSVIDKAAGYSFNLGLRFEIDRT